MINRPTYKLNPQELGQARGMGSNVLFKKGTNVFNTTTTTKEQVKSNLINFILTNKGERLFDPTFGGNLRASIFEQDTAFDDIAAALEADIYAYVPNIIIKSIDVKKYSDENLVNIAINYSINNQPDNLAINVSTNNLTK